MKTDDRFQLLHGPYNWPKTRVGKKLFCEIRGTVTVAGFRFGLIPWPTAKWPNSRPVILCGDLVKAVRCESELAVAHHFGVSVSTAKMWRRMLGVPRVTEGSHRLWHDIATTRTDNRIERARWNSKQPTALAKLSASLKGRIQSPSTIAAVSKAAKRPRSAAWKAKMAAYWRQRGHPVGNPEGRFWTAAEDALLGTARDAVVGKQINRTAQAVADRRGKLGVAAFCRQKQK